MSAPLSGVRVWLSGSVPENATDDDKFRLHQFVKHLASKVFEFGGTIAHGCHPSFMPSLLEAAKEFKDATAMPAPLALFVSRWFSKHPAKYDIDLVTWNSVCVDPVEEIAEALDTSERTTEELRGMSLSIMRQTMAARCNAIVAIGGKWWTLARNRAGVSEEINLAAASQLPLFLIGGMGGAVKGLIAAKPELLRNCANGLSESQNEEIARESDPIISVAQLIEQLQRLPLRAIAGREDRPFKILCLDGGGIRGAYTAAVLSYWEKALNFGTPGRTRLVDHFDLIAGTSTGGILAIGLGLGMNAEDLLNFYVKKGENIFGTGEGLNKWWHSFRHWFTSKFDQKYLKEEILAAYQSSTVGRTFPRGEWFDNSLCRILIPAYNVSIDRPHLFRTPYGRYKNSDKGQDAVSVALSTAAAPTYFSPVTSKGSVAEILAVDGGVWANSPVSVAIAEAIAELKIPVESIRVLNIGTTHTTQLTGQPMLLDGKVIGNLLQKILGYLFVWPVGMLGSLAARLGWRPTRVHGTLGWVANIAGLLMKTQAQTSDMMGECILGDRYIRVDSESPFGELDDVKRIEHFTSLGQEAARHPATFARVQSLFFS